MNITVIVEAAIALIAAICTTVIVPYIKSKTTAQQQETVNQWAQIAVSAAEQIYSGPGRGAEKKYYVLEFLKEKGVIVDESALDALIESAVFALKKGL